MRFFTFLIALLLPFFVFAQEDNSQNPEQTLTGVTLPTLPACQDTLSFTGPTQIKMNMSYDFGLADNNGSVRPFGMIKIISESRNEEFVLDGNNLNYSFATPGIAEMIFTPRNDTTYSCQGEIKKTIHIFREKIAYIGAERADIADDSLASVFREKSVLLEPIFAGNTFHIEDQWALWNTLGNADIVVFNHKNITEIFPEMERLQRLKEHNFANTKFFIISEYSRTFLGKILAKSVANLGIKDIHLISEDQFSTLLGKWSYEDNRSATLGDPLLYEKNNFAITMNHFLEYLAYAGVSYQFLGFLLLLSVVALVFNVLKQVIGFDTFTLYYPLLLAVIISQMGYVFSGMFAAVAIIAIFLVRKITNRIQLLVNAKKAFLISVYVLLSLAMLGVDNLFEMGIFDYNIFSNSLTVIAIFAILFIMERIFDGIQLFSKKGFFTFIRYAFIVMIAVLIFFWQDLKFFLISYPDVIFLIVIANLLVGRYTGLQVVEYMRFSPILKNINEEE